MKRALHAIISVVRRLATMGRRRRLARDIEDEVSFHLAMREAERARAGASDAPRAARRQFGNVTVVKEQVRDMWTFPSFESFWQDVRYAVRTLRKSPGFTIVAVLVLAIGIGGNTAIYSLVDAMFVRGLPYHDADRLVVLIGNVQRATAVERRGGSYPDFVDWRAQATTVEGMAIYNPGALTISGGDEPERLSIESVSAPYFSLLRLTPAYGRAFGAAEDDAANRKAVVIISDALWHRRFGADPGVVGKTIQFVGAPPFEVIGVMPERFRGLSDQADAWIPYVMSGAPLEGRGNRGFNVLARLRSDVSIEQTRAELDSISKKLALAYPASNDKRGIEVSPLSVETFGQIQPILTTLMVAVSFVLLIACTNVANLLISRSEARQREIAVRTALGAGRARLWRQLVTESCVLALLGAVAGLGLTELAVRALVSSSPITLPSFLDPGINLSVLAFTMVCALGSGVLLGLAPVMHARVAKLADALKDSSRGSSTARSQRTRGTLVVVEVALAMVLLIGAGLMIRSVQKLTALDPGFDPDSVLTLTVNIPRAPAVPPPPSTPPTGARPAGTPAAPAAPSAPPAPPLVVPSAMLLERVRAVAGVTAASLTTDVPLGPGSSAIFYTAEGDTTSDATTMPRAYVHRVSPGFFRTLKVAFKAGQDFTEADGTPASTAVIVSENVARRFWPGQDPIGKRIKQGGPASTAPWLSIVGVVAETKYRGLPENPTADPDVYLPFFERSGQALVIRTAVPPESVTAAVRAAIRAAHPGLVVYNIATMSSLVAAQTAPSRFTSWLLTIFAGVALTLSVVGIYGVMLYLVAQRGREFGIRLALGAGSGEIVRLVLHNGATLILIGTVIGVAAAFALSRYLGTLLFQVTTLDPASAAAVVVLALVALVACYIPALRATRVDPVTALRAD